MLVKVLTQNGRYADVSARILVFFATTTILLAGCSSPPSVHRSLTAPYHPANVTRLQEALPDSIRRVAVLPIPRSRTDANQVAGVEALEADFLAELNKLKRFEVIPISPEKSRALTGSMAWNAEERFPADFLERLKQATGCDAVILVSLTTFRAYPPLQVGWKARLVDCEKHLTWWAVDEVFDAGDDSVAAAALSFAHKELNLPESAADSAAVLGSPRRFGQYTANAIINTLPGR